MGLEDQSVSIFNLAGVEFTHAGKEPLKNKWAFWHLEGNSEKSWEDCLRKLCVVDNIEDFWSAYGKYLPASELTMGSDYYLFKDGVKPMWEVSRASCDGIHKVSFNWKRQAMFSREY